MAVFNSHVFTLLLSGLFHLLDNYQGLNACDRLFEGQHRDYERRCTLPVIVLIIYSHYQIGVTQYGTWVLRELLI